MDGIVVLVKREMMVILLLPFRCGVALRERERESSERLIVYVHTSRSMALESLLARIFLSLYVSVSADAWLILSEIG